MDLKGNIPGKASLKREERSVETTTATIAASGQRVKRRPEMDSSGFHGDTFNSGFGDFWTMKRNSQYLHPYGPYKRRPEMDSSGFHGDTFNSGFGDFWTMKRNMAADNAGGVDKRRPEMDSSGFHGDTFSSGFGDFYTMKRNPILHQEEKRRPEMDSSGFHGDTFNGGFGDFWTMKRTALAHPYTAQAKRRPEMDSSGFHGDTFNGDFGDFWTMKRTALARPLSYPGKRRPEMDSSGFHGDTFNGGFGDFWTMKRAQGVPERSQNGVGEFLDYEDRPLGKRRPEMDSSGFHGDTFNGGFGDFWTMKKRSLRARRGVEGGEKADPSALQDERYDELLVDEDGSPSRWAYGRLEAKRRPEMDSSGFHGDTFNSGFGDFWTMKRNQLRPYTAVYGKRRPEMDSSGFHGDTFNSGFGDFWTMKRGGGYGVVIPMNPNKRKPEMDSSGFHGDTFHGGFGDFWTMKRSGYADRLAGKEGSGIKQVDLHKADGIEGVKDKGSEDDRGDGSGNSEGKNDDKKN
ncbi:hypothetical protein J437_LFUL008402 [Ladona fulva]|uniref:Uncharacterized protein n=1 Tax=Ladona fulva TaxID=123851 RepID=A0A8K0K3A4_LADFU|nr:hypothetical protein J437_LFUL008402 [Ladona fulva]